ncbi:PAS domain-containing protein [Alteromonas sp. 345S023]|uniref:HTH-type transcriptional regulatory protein TyrR n=1 Tax=Alteromonas profundi TaxID=2696062 RepID=A0A7X5LJB9_9ALTE|nr:sigma 54-interacting transcriptional regulator [Alteromonas profundi]NDV90425.1 PAS domain-containing protein [Alteromonas profundi]
MTVDLDTLQPVLDALQDGVFITNGEGMAITINHAYERITGLQRHKIVGRHVSELVKHNVISKSVSLEVIRERQPVTLVQTIMGDRKILVSGNPMFDSHGHIKQVVLNVRDVTELLKAKHAEEQLEQILSKFEEYNNALPNKSTHPGLLVGEKTKDCYALARRVAPTKVKILIQGETGTGKTQLAQYIHQESDRSANPFMALNCAAMPEGLIEAELFGYVPGAFTGASNKGKAGLLEVANGGTLFLDEIGDLPLSLQAKLLKVIEDNKYLPIGGTKLKSTNVRIITATHHDLTSAIAQGKFREDLYYRISVLPLKLLPLRQRQEEILPLFEHFLTQFCEQYHCVRTLSSEARELIMQHSWPGNIRELKNTAERLVVSTTENEIEVKDLPENLRYINTPTSEVFGGSLKDQVKALESRLIESALHQYGTTRAAAQALGINQSTLVKKRQTLRNENKVYS